jgi:serine protease Do
VIGLIAPGSKVPVSVIREGKERSVRVEIGALEANEVARVVASASEPGTLQALGMVVRELQETDENPSDLRGGVLVTKVDDESAADESGVRAGDILTRFGRTPISRLTDMESAIEQIKPGDSVSLRLIRQGSPQFIGIKVPEND